MALLFALALVILWVKPLGGYMTAVFLGLPHPLLRPLGKCEALIYRLCGIHPEKSMSWRSYSFCVLAFGIYGIALLMLIFMTQGALPLNPEHMAGLSAHTAFNAAISFVTNTDWQSFSGETQLSYFSQTVALTVQMFLSAATGLAVAVAVCRALAAKQSHTIGNFWVDMVRSVLYILLPLALIFALILVSQGVVQNYAAYLDYTSLEGASGKIATGPAAYQTAITILGSNGGGFFTANTAHPFANPNAITNMLHIVAVFLLPVAFVYTTGLLMRDRRQSLMILTAMLVLFIPLSTLIVTQEYTVSPKFDPKVIDISEGNMEGKEIRLGVASSAFWAAGTTTTAGGSANAALDSFAPLSGFAMMALMQFGEVVFGGVGSGIYGMVIYIVMAVFIAGLMVGRTPEFLGKKLTPFDVKMAAIALLVPTFLSLVGTAIAISTEAGRTALSNPGAHAFSQILYAYTSATNNNGSAFAGLVASSPFYDISLAICMLLGRYGIIFCALGLAGSLAAKNITPTSAGTLPTHTPLFTIVLVMVIILLGLLNYIPVLALGPVAEHIQVMAP